MAANKREKDCKTNAPGPAFYVPAGAALLHENEQRQAVAEGHEPGLHGWIHELNSKLPLEAERDLMLRSMDTAPTRAGAWSSRGPSQVPNARLSTAASRTPAFSSWVLTTSRAIAS